MTTVVFRFPHGRYVATPWGEPRTGVELPPSPWRLLRALYATWRLRLPSLDEATAHQLFAALAAPPAFDVPRHVVRDGCAVFERDAELAAHWSVDLTAAQRAALVELVRAVPYLGRAESRCHARLDPHWRPAGHDAWSPVDVADSITPGTVVTALLAPELPLVVDSLLAVPSAVRDRGLPLPPGTRLLGYQRAPRSSAVPVAPTAVRFAIEDTARPLATAALAYTDLLRRAALSQLGRLRPEPGDTVLGGRTATSAVMSDRHAHAHYLPLLAGERLTGLLVWAPATLPDDELKALTAVRALRGSGCAPARLRVRGVGAIADIAPWLVGPAPTYRSITPFATPRHAKRSAVDHITAELSRELAHRGLPLAAADILPIDPTPWLRYRPSAPPTSSQGRGGRPSAFLRLTFGTPVPGPLSLGHLSHFGLGLFHPDPPPDEP